MVTFCKTFWSKRVLQLWMHSLVLRCLSCKWTRNINLTQMANGKILPCLLVSMTPCSLSSIDILTSSGTAGTESLESGSFGSFGCACSGSFVACLRKKSRLQDMEMHGAWHVDAFWVWILISKYFPGPPCSTGACCWVIAWKKGCWTERPVFTLSMLQHQLSKDGQSGWCESG